MIPSIHGVKSSIEITGIFFCKYNTFTAHLAEFSSLGAFVQVDVNAGNTDIKCPLISSVSFFRHFSKEVPSYCVQKSNDVTLTYD